MRFQRGHLVVVGERVNIVATTFLLSQHHCTCQNKQKNRTFLDIVGMLQLGP